MYTKGFMKLLESLNEDDWKIKVNSDWTIKDVISHLVGWEREAVKALEEEWKTKEKPLFLLTEDFNEFNKKNVEHYKRYNSRELLDEWKKLQNILDEKINEIGEENLRKEPELYDWVFDEGEENHYKEHYEQIKKVLGNERS